MNIQYAIERGRIYVLEANPRASRTVPIVSKACNIQMARIATRLMMGGTLTDADTAPRTLHHYGVKEAVFPFNMLPEVDPLLGPEMRSTGEVLGLAESFALAFLKAEEAAGQRLPDSGAVLVSVARRDRAGLEAVARELVRSGFTIYATEGTRRHLAGSGIDAEPALKLHEGRPNILDLIKNRQIGLIVNTPAGPESEHDDSYIRKNAIKYKIPYITTVPAALAAARGITAGKSGKVESRSLQEYHRNIGMA
jgi:carbamoyl-phosphate synthase large subunit